VLFVALLNVLPPKLISKFGSYRKYDAIFEVFTVVKIQVDVVCVVTPCSVAVGYQRFGEPCCFHLQGEMLQ
jgi:hypothetical protein